jgi:hypothetical protein
VSLEISATERYRTAFPRADDGLEGADGVVLAERRNGTCPVTQVSADDVLVGAGGDLLLALLIMPIAEPARP